MNGRIEKDITFETEFFIINVKNNKNCIVRGGIYVLIWHGWRDHYTYIDVIHYIFLDLISKTQFVKVAHRVLKFLIFFVKQKFNLKFFLQLVFMLILLGE